MKNSVNLAALVCDGNLFNKRRAHKDMKYLCDFVMCKII